MWGTWEWLFLFANKQWTSTSTGQISRAGTLSAARESHSELSPQPRHLLGKDKENKASCELLGDRFVASCFSESSVFLLAAVQCGREEPAPFLHLSLPQGAQQAQGNADSKQTCWAASTQGHFGLFKGQQVLSMKGATSVWGWAGSGGRTQGHRAELQPNTGLAKQADRQTDRQTDICTAVWNGKAGC